MYLNQCNNTESAQQVYAIQHKATQHIPIEVTCSFYVLYVAIHLHTLVQQPYYCNITEVTVQFSSALLCWFEKELTQSKNTFSVGAEEG